MKTYKKLLAMILTLVMVISVLPISQTKINAAEIPDFNSELINSNTVIYNDFEGVNRDSEFILQNKYNSTVSVVQDSNSNYLGEITTSSSSGVTFSGLWHYGVVLPKTSETFDASSFVDGGRLTFYINSSVASRAYLGIQVGDTWYSYQGFTDDNESTQSAGRNSGRLQETTQVGVWKKFSIKLSNFAITDWSAVQGIAIGFYSPGTYYIDNIGFVAKEDVANDETENPTGPSDVTYKVEAEDMQLNRMRFPTTSGIDSGEAVGVYWSNNETFKDDLQDDSFARMVVEAPDDGTYNIQMRYFAGTYPIRVYVNGMLQIDETLPGNNWSSANADLSLELVQGKNVIIIAVAAWGCFDYLILPSQLKVVKNTSVDNTFYAQDTLLQATHLAPTGSLHDPEADLYTGILDYDTSEDYISKVIYNVDGKEGQSLTLHYYVENYTESGEAAIECSINDNAKFTVDLSGTETNKELEYTIDANTLVENGFWDGTNKIVFSPVGNDAKLGMDYFTLQESLDYVPVDRTTYTGVELKDLITYRGRSLDIGNSVTFDWSGSGFAFNFEGSGDIVATVTVSGGSKTKIAIYVDDEDRTTTNSEKRIVKTISNGTSKVVLAKNLPEGKHTIEVLKTSEANGSLAQLDSLTVNTGSKLTKWKESDRNMMVIGGSVSCGNQIYADGREDASLSYVANLALAYNMNWQTISCSGRGITQGYNSEDNWAPSREKQLISLNEYTSFFRDQNTLWDYKNFTPDVIIVNAGGNDLGDAVMEQFGTTVDDFCNAVVEFSSQLRAQYPEALICWFYGVYVNRAYKDEFQAAVDSMNDPGVKLVYTPQMNSGAANHPDVQEHVYLSQIFSSVFSEYWNIENPLDEYEENKAPIFDKSQLNNHAFVYNDFEGNNRGDELTLENKYNTNIDVKQDANLNYEGFIKTNDSNGPGVNINGMWRYGIVKPKDVETFDASKLVEDGSLSFYVNSAVESNLYLAVKVGDVWYPYKGYTDTNLSTQEAARNSGRLQEKYAGDNVWKKYVVNMSDFEITDWSAVQSVGIGFYESGDFYIDNIEFSSPTVFNNQEEVTTPEENSTEEKTTVDQITETPTTEEQTIQMPTTKKVIAPRRTNVKSALKDKNSKKIKLSIKRVKGVRGYQVAVYKTLKNANKNKKAVYKKHVRKYKLKISSRKFRKTKKLYVKVRAYKLYGKKKVYAKKWSKPKKVRIKK